MNDETVVLCVEFLYFSVSSVEERSSIKKYFFGLFNNKNCKSLSLELKEGNDVVEENFEVL